jgi:hypothetical protein
MTAITQLSKTISTRILVNNVQFNINSFTNTTTIEEYIEKQILLPTATTNQLIDLTPITAGTGVVKEIFLQTEQQITMRLNLITNPEIIIKDICYLSTDNITAIYLTNTSGTDSSITLLVA